MSTDRNSATERGAIDDPSIAAAVGTEPDATRHDESLDHFVEKDGLRFAGTHLIVDLWEATRLDDLPAVEDALRRATEAAGATLLNIDLHHFTPNGGISGVAVLAESHISIHTWPERAYAAIDIFMCGDARPHAAIAVLREAFAPARIQLAEHKRGMVPC
ncbi:adenosylmethionine decarboxylase [Salinarimonas rosea]|uniref:adenosylmethionine decarboxylase n=1 Tax=Salinarimonas rosea TaxID=552063 RepID=UPI000693B237|nr:adenosylmethionine decarboxylase [Salinarimonas rosea]